MDKGSISNKKPTEEEKTQNDAGKSWRCRDCHKRFRTMSLLAEHKNAEHSLLIKEKK